MPVISWSCLRKSKGTTSQINLSLVHQEKDLRTTVCSTSIPFILKQPNMAAPEQAGSTDPDVLFEENSKPCFLWTLILAPCLMPIVWNYHVKLTKDRLSIGYSARCGQRVVDKSKIRSVEVVEHINGLCQWGGYGIRYQLPHWEVGYIARKGPGVRMEFVDENGKDKACTFSCFDPERLVHLLTGE